MWLNKITPDFFKQSQQSNFVLIVNLSATNETLAVLTSASYEVGVEGPLKAFQIIQYQELKLYDTTKFWESRLWRFNR